MLRPDEREKLSPSSRFNLRFMWRMNFLSIAVFVLAVLAKLLYEWLK